MKRLLFFLTFNTVCLFSFSSFSQTETTILSNGVVVHQSIGVEGVVTQGFDVQGDEAQGINFWTLDTCLKVIEDIKLKQAELNSDDQAKEYAVILKEIEARILQLTTKN